jgi:hypothetical protein
MGCGASVCGRRNNKHEHMAEARRALITPPEVQGRAGSGMVTPPEGQGRADSGMVKKGDLRIDTAAPSRSDVGIAETPVGKQAEEYKYYCPLCM